MTFPYFEFDVGYETDAPSAQECREQDCEMQLARGYPEDVADIVDNLDDVGEFYAKVAECLRIVRSAPKDHAFLAVQDLRTYLAQEMAKERV